VRAEIEQLKAELSIQEKRKEQEQEQEQQQQQQQQQQQGRGVAAAAAVVRSGPGEAAVSAPPQLLHKQYMAALGVVD
jgi:hypothetical protein